MPCLHNHVDQKTVLPVEEGDLEDWDNFLNRYYKGFPPGTIQKNHIFEVSADRPTIMKVRTHDGAPVKEINFQKKTDKRTHHERVSQMKADSRTKKASPGLKAAKKIELQKYVDVVGEFAKNALYDAPSPEEVQKVKEEKAAKGKEKRKVKKEAKERAAKAVKTK